MNLLILSRFDKCGAGPRYRVYQYFPYLEKSGFILTVKPLLDAKYLEGIYIKGRKPYFHLLKLYLKRAWFLWRNKNKFSLVLMDPELFPSVPYGIEKFFLPKKYVVDIDDAVFHTYDLHKSSLVRKFFGNKIDRIFKGSQHVIAGNDYLRARVIKSETKQTSMIPTILDATLYKPSETFEPRSSEEVVIGWVGSPPTVKYLELIKPVLLSIAKKHNILLSVIGAKFEMDGVKVFYQDWPNGWNEAQEIELLQKIDIGIMPLNEGLWEQGKCGFKLIKYMALGKPIVSSALDAGIMEHGKDSYLANSLEDWETYLLALIEDPLKREAFGRYGREKMVKEYSLQVKAPILCEVLKRASEVEI